MNRSAMDNFIDQIDTLTNEKEELISLLKEFCNVSPLGGQTQFNINIMALQKKAEKILC